MGKSTIHRHFQQLFSHNQRVNHPGYHDDGHDEKRTVPPGGWGQYPQRRLWGPFQHGPARRDACGGDRRPEHHIIYIIDTYRHIWTQQTQQTYICIYIIQLYIYIIYNIFQLIAVFTELYMGYVSKSQFPPVTVTKQQIAMDVHPQLLGTWENVGKMLGK